MHKTFLLIAAALTAVTALRAQPSPRNTRHVPVSWSGE